eukprot:gene36743-43829_t
MSDSESVTVAVKPSREGCPLPYASVRLTVVLDLLVHIFTTELAEIALCPHAKKFPQVGNFDIALFKYKSLSLQLRSKKYSVNSTMCAFAVWENPESTQPEGEMSDSSAGKKIFVAGDQDDYSPELEELVFSFVVLYLKS